MEIKLSVVASDTALADVKLVELVEYLSRLENIQIKPAATSSSGGMIPRMGILEVVAVVVTSAAATQLALAVRDVARKQSIEIVCTSPDGSSIQVSARGGDSQAASDIVGFLTKQYEKHSSVTQITSPTPLSETQYQLETDENPALPEAEVDSSG
jgi:hypothetical protein